ncbi:synaptotagmin-12-like [Schistocerca gregaria]|uniref:synaptotagmin-12-like n=1 Tax=Schistocerca gregaria TaxID=7010 RepID=UPI00211DFF78|nr:synaptotagmin-12-like [Schistocerca gregaria]
MSALAALVVLALVALVVVAACRVLGLWTWLAAWVASPREEKVALTRVDGHYDANGVLVRAESDTSLEVALRFGGAAAAAAGVGAMAIPPQPLRAPATDLEVCDVPAGLRRAASCESVCSDTSVVLGDLQEAPVAGYLCVGLESDRFSGELVVTVLEAKELADSPDSYVRLSLSPDRNCVVQTRVYRRSSCPSYKEKFVFSLDPAELSRRTLSLQVFATDKEVTTLLGEAELRLSDISMRQPVTTWLTLTDTGQHGTEWGEVMFSLSYLPTAERLTVVIVKARNLRFSTDPVPGDPFVKVYLLQHGKKVHKKKTTTKRGERCPIFNEAMIFSVPAHALQTIQLRVTVAENTGEPRARAVGHVIVGAQATGKALSHWSQMLSSLRKPIAMWHVLRK